MGKKYFTLLLATSLILVSGPGQAEDWSPEGVITLQVGFGAGGSTDIIGRLLAANVEENTGWHVIVENKAGGGGVAMLSGMVHEKADGRKLGLAVNVPILINLVQRGDKLPFKLEDFDYIGTVCKAELALVTKADAQFNDLKCFLDFARTRRPAVAFDGPIQQIICKP